MLLSFRFSPLLAVVGLWLALFATSCGKDEPRPAVVPGAIEARVIPVGSVRTVTLTGAGGRTYQTVTDATTGVFSFTGLAPGRYILSFETTLAYKAPAPVAVDVAAAGITKLTLKPLIRDRTIRGTMTWTVGDTNYSANSLGGTITDDSLDLSGKDSSATENYEILLIIPKEENQSALFRGVGAYQLGTAMFPKAIYTNYINNNETLRAYQYRTSSAIPQRLGVITITSFDSKAFTISGTFEFTALAISDSQLFSTPPTSSITVTKGTFNLTF
ncbi:DUF6252 family protein [uncultured Hymenobacter sp.]|uniref:DUF6252 family protein n=1 Tax=uncultured Hymenobacter sp. TaxID=170016 RepID=UPI0035CAB686